MPRDYWTVADLAHHWGVHRNQVLKWIGTGLLPAWHPSPRVLRIRHVEVVTFERRQHVSPISPTSSDTRSPSSRSSV